MTIENYNGILTISEIVDDQLIKQRYIFVTEKMAVASFKRYIKNLKKSK